MEITLNHTIVPAYNNVASARFYEDIFGFEYLKEWGHFAVLKINSHLTFDFITKDTFNTVHYAFKVTDEQFDTIFKRIQDREIAYGSDPFDLENASINHNHGGRGVYFRDPNEHVLEILTADYILD